MFVVTREMVNGAWNRAHAVMDAGRRTSMAEELLIGFVEHLKQDPESMRQVADYAMDAWVEATDEATEIGWKLKK